MKAAEFETAVAEFLRLLRDEKRLQESSIRLYQTDLAQLQEAILLNSPELLKQIAQGLASSTVTRKLIVWRSFLKRLPTPYCSWLENTSFPKIRAQQPRFLREHEIFALENACVARRQSSRDRLFIFLGVELGLRLQEILGLKFSDLQGDWIRVLRKGGHEQNLPLSKSLQLQTRLYREERRARDEDFLFEGRKGQPLTSRAAQKILDSLAKQAGIKNGLSPHALRHTFATRLAANGANLVALKEILGHRQLKTTERYLHVTPEYLRDALQYLRPRKT